MGDTAIDLPECNLVRDLDCRLETRAAGTLQIVCGCMWIKAGAEHALARQVEVLRVLHHRAGRHLSDLSASQSIFVDQALQCSAQHRLVVELGISAMGSCEWTTRAADDGNASD